VNTRPMLVRDRLGQLYLRVFDGWMSAAALGGPWAVATETKELAKGLA
jgi:hypothetical protein